MHTYSPDWENGEHRVRHAQRKVVGLPDEEFEKMLRRALDPWGDYLAPGDRCFALEPERQRGALLHRNLAIGCACATRVRRRSEIATIRIDPADRQGHKLHVQTKGHCKGDNEYLRVVRYQDVAAQLWTYFTKYRPIVSTRSDHRHLFLSHGLRAYGQPITDSAIRELFDRGGRAPQCRRGGARDPARRCFSGRVRTKLDGPCPSCRGCASRRSPGLTGAEELRQVWSDPAPRDG